MNKYRDEFSFITSRDGQLLSPGISPLCNGSISFDEPPKSIVTHHLRGGESSGRSQEGGADNGLHGCFDFIFEETIFLKEPA